MTSLSPFANEPVLELRRAPVRAQLADAMAAVDARLPLDVPVWVGDDRGAGDGLLSTDPGSPDRVVARTGRAAPAEVDAAVETAGGARPPPGGGGGGRRARRPPGAPPPPRGRA